MTKATADNASRSHRVRVRERFGARVCCKLFRTRPHRRRQHRAARCREVARPTPVDAARRSRTLARRPAVARQIEDRARRSAPASSRRRCWRRCLGHAAWHGVVIGATAMAGDLLSSFCKRRLKLAPSSQALGLDQIPEVLLPAVVSRTWFDLSLLDVVIGRGGVLLPRAGALEVVCIARTCAIRRTESAWLSVPHRVKHRTAR